MVAGPARAQMTEEALRIRLGHTLVSALVSLALGQTAKTSSLGSDSENCFLIPRLPTRVSVALGQTANTTSDSSCACVGIWPRGAWPWPPLVSS